MAPSRVHEGFSYPSIHNVSGGFFECSGPLGCVFRVGCRLYVVKVCSSSSRFPPHNILPSLFLSSSVSLVSTSLGTRCPDACNDQDNTVCWVSNWNMYIQGTHPVLLLEVRATVWIPEPLHPSRVGAIPNGLLSCTRR